MKKHIALSLALCLILAMSACGSSSTAPAPASSAAPTPSASAAPAAPAPTPRSEILTMGTGDVGGTMYPVGSTIAKMINDTVPGVKLNIETSSGSPDNARLTQSGDLDLGMCTADVALNAFNGNGAFAGTPCPDLRSMFGVYASVSQWLAPESTGIVYIDDLKGKKASIGMTASATEIAAKIAIETAGIDYPAGVGGQFLGIGEGADAVRDGILDAVTQFGGIPAGGLLDLCTSKPTRMLMFRPEHLQKILDDYPYYYKATIGLDIYPLVNTEPIDTFGVKVIGICNAKMDEQLVYDFVKAIIENREDLAAGYATLKDMLDIEFTAQDLTIPMHPGAERYFKEIGVL